jgi:hypothetical protein
MHHVFERPAFRPNAPQFRARLEPALVAAENPTLKLALVLGHLQTAGGLGLANATARGHVLIDQNHSCCLDLCEGLSKKLYLDDQSVLFEFLQKEV